MQQNYEKVFFIFILSNGIFHGIYANDTIICADELFICEYYCLLSHKYLSQNSK